MNTPRRIRGCSSDNNYGGAQVMYEYVKYSIAIGVVVVRRVGCVHKTFASHESIEYKAK